MLGRRRRRSRDPRYMLLEALRLTRMALQAARRAEALLRRYSEHNEAEIRNIRMLETILEIIAIRLEILITTNILNLNFFNEITRDLREASALAGSPMPQLRSLLEELYYAVSVAETRIVEDLGYPTDYGAWEPIRLEKNVGPRNVRTETKKDRGKAELLGAGEES